MQRVITALSLAGKSRVDLELGAATAEVTSDLQPGTYAVWTTDGEDVFIKVDYDPSGVDDTNGFYLPKGQILYLRIPQMAQIGAYSEAGDVAVSIHAVS